MMTDIRKTDNCTESNGNPTLKISTDVKELQGFLSYDGEPVSVEDMNQAIKDRFSD